MPAAARAPVYLRQRLEGSRACVLHHAKLCDYIASRHTKDHRDRTNENCEPSCLGSACPVPVYCNRNAGILIEKIPGAGSCSDHAQEIQGRQSQTSAEQLRGKHGRTRPAALPRMQRKAQCRRLPGLYRTLTLAFIPPEAAQNYATIQPIVTTQIDWPTGGNQQEAVFLKSMEFPCYNSKLSGCSSAG